MTSPHDKPLRDHKIEVLTVEHDDKTPDSGSKSQFCGNNFKDFAYCTSLHGFQYLGENKRSPFER